MPFLYGIDVGGALIDESVDTEEICCNAQFIILFSTTNQITSDKKAAIEAKIGFVLTEKEVER